MPFHRCPTPADTQAALETLANQGSEAIFLFFGSEQTATGASWCPDCVTADPVLRAALARLRPDLTVHECPVGERADWKGRMEHPYRVHPLFRVARIPTVIRIAGPAEVARLVEAECADPARLAAFLAR